MSATTAQAASTIIENLIERIISAVHPLRIVLFGSAARGEMRADSDIDVMVVMPDGAHCSNTARYLYERMYGLGFPVDIVVATPLLLEQHKDNVGLIYRSILAEGKDIYVA